MLWVAKLAGIAMIMSGLYIELITMPVLLNRATRKTSPSEQAAHLQKAQRMNRIKCVLMIAGGLASIIATQLNQ
jgi:hypothetical protein